MEDKVNDEIKKETNEASEQEFKVRQPMLFVLLAVTCFMLVVSIYVNVFNENKVENLLNNMRIERYKGYDYYIITGTYDGEHEIAYYILDSDSSYRYKDVNKVMTYDEYVNFCTSRNIDIKYKDKNKNYIVFSYSKESIRRATLAQVKENGKNIELYVWDDSLYNGYSSPMINAYAIIVPTDVSANTWVNVIPMYTESEFDDLVKGPVFPVWPNPETTVDKPVIYLYPTKDTKVDVKLVNSGLLTCSYPKYENKWSVLAKPNGDLTYLTTGRSLYSLYYESQSKIDFKVTNEGFVVKGEDTISFLEDKLAILGLNEHEAQEFIIYWLPKLEANKYNYIRFATKEEIDFNMPLEVNPNPDSIIRVLMTFKALNEPISVKEQVLKTPTRDGFVLVEWGGTEIK